MLEMGHLLDAIQGAAQPLFLSTRPTSTEASSCCRIWLCAWSRAVLVGGCAVLENPNLGLGEAVVPFRHPAGRC